ncbi:hypothetical protein Q9R29_02065 [Rothia sp. ARF10]|nr:hypothetical protein [Rothia sp. ARF10]
MEQGAGTTRRSNLPWAVGFALVLLVVFMLGSQLGNTTSGTLRSVGWASVGTTVALSPFALIWLVGELHLRFSPRDRVLRGVVGWTLVLAVIALIVFVGPVALYIAIVSFILSSEGGAPT